MKQTSVFVQIGSRENNPIKGAISTLAEASGGVIVSQLVNDQEVEADIAVVDSVERALRAIKETECTIVLLAHSSKMQETESRAFAARYPTRVKTGSSTESDVDDNFVVTLMASVANKARQEVSL